MEQPKSKFLLTTLKGKFYIHIKKEGFGAMKHLSIGRTAKEAWHYAEKRLSKLAKQAKRNKLTLPTGDAINY